MKARVEKILNDIVLNNILHKDWLYTLSIMENLGATKIIKTQRHLEVTAEILKHSFEEARHAYFFRAKAENIQSRSNRKGCLIGGAFTRNYLRRIDIMSSRLLKPLGYQGDLLKEAAYYLTTYIIEKRAEMLYPLYEKVLKSHKANFSLQSVIFEELGHLEQMEGQLKFRLAGHEGIIEKARLAEEQLFKELLNRIETDILLRTSLLGNSFSSLN